MNSEKDYPVGILIIHGIGLQSRGETLIAYSDAIFSWIQDRLQGVANGQRHRNVTPESLEKELPGISQEPISQLDQKNFRKYLAFLRTSQKLRQTHALPFPSPPNEPILGYAELSRANISDSTNPATAIIEMNWTDSLKNDHATRWLIAESWWAEVFKPPSLSQILKWAPFAVPITIISHFFSNRFIIGNPRHRLNWWLGEVRFVFVVLVMLLSAIFLSPLIYLFLIGTQLLSLIPWKRVQSVAESIKTLLVGVLGDAITLIESPSNRTAILSKVLQDFDYVAGQCKSILVVGHSQGAMLAYLACQKRLRDVCTLVTLGSGIRKIRALISVALRKDQLIQNAISFLVASNLLSVTLITTLILRFLGNIDSKMALYLAGCSGILMLCFGISGIALFYAYTAGIPPEDIFWRRRMNENTNFRWRDIRATHDPISADDLDTIIRPTIDAEVKLDPPTNFPNSVKVTNKRSALRDHTCYLENREEVVASLVWECAYLDSSDLHLWLAPNDSIRDNEISYARARIIRRSKWFNNFTALVALIALAMYFSANELPWNLIVSNISITLFAANTGFHVKDIGFFIVVISAFVAVRTARIYSLKHLLAALLERRNYYAKESASHNLFTEGLQLRSYRRYGSLSGYEFLGLLISYLSPAIVSVVLSRNSTAWELVLWVLITTVFVHLIAVLLRSIEGRYDAEQCYPQAAYQVKDN